jgi:4-alpha-glucanotransferase
MGGEFFFDLPRQKLRFDSTGSVDRGLPRRREDRTYERGPERNSPGSMPGIEAALSEVAASNTVLAFVRTADLAMKTAALNMPGTGKEHPNWAAQAPRACAIALRASVGTPD